MLYNVFWAERKVAAWQNRVGPNQSGSFGLFQPLADGLKIILQEEFEPNTKNRFCFFVVQHDEYR
jgi:NADH-quinone oxidoreductase subunit H